MTGRENDFAAWRQAGLLGGDLRLAKERSSELWKQGAGVKARDRVRIGHLEKTKIDTKTIASLQVYKFIQIPKHVGL